jgi:mannitol 2-dehydrogenase
MLGHKYAHEAMRDEDVVAWVRAVIGREAIPTLAPIEGVDFRAYLDTCIERFGNEAVGDTIARLCLDGSNRQPKFVLPTLRDRLAAGAPIEGLALEIALWRAYCAGGGAPGAPVIEDERAARLHSAAKGAPEAFLEIGEIFGDLRQDPRVVAAVTAAAAQIEGDGVRGAIRAYATV